MTSFHPPGKRSLRVSLHDPKRLRTSESLKLRAALLSILSETRSILDKRVKTDDDLHQLRLLSEDRDHLTDLIQFEENRATERWNSGTSDTETDRNIADAQHIAANSCV